MIFSGTVYYLKYRRAQGMTGHFLDTIRCRHHNFEVNLKYLSFQLIPILSNPCYIEISFETRDTYTS